MKIGIIGIGHPFKSQYNALKTLNYDIVLCDINPSKLNKYTEKKYSDYHDLLYDVDLVFISTPPITHFNIIKFFLENNKKVICEKPAVVNKNELYELKKLINNNFYNILHFSFGEEILWFKENFDMKQTPIKIEAFINDPYIENNHIRFESLGLHGAYLDETINPLSAIARLYGTNIKFVNANKVYDDISKLDYKAISHFNVNNIPTYINVIWNDNRNREKYIDLYFKDRIIRLDSYNVKVIDLTKNEILFVSNNNRMYMHYINGLKSMNFNSDELNFSLAINSAIMEGVDE